MDFDNIINKCIDVFSHATSNDPYCLERYKKNSNSIKKYTGGYKKGTYPRNFQFFHYHFISHVIWIQMKCMR